MLKTSTLSLPYDKITPKITFACQGWEISFTEGNFLFSNIETVSAQPQSLRSACIEFPFSLKQLLTDFVTFGLTDSLQSFPEFSACVPCLVTAAPPTDSFYIEPKCLLEEDTPISCVVSAAFTTFVPRSLNLALVFIHTLPHLTIGHQLSHELTQPQNIPLYTRETPSSESSFHIEGVARLSSQHTYSLHFSGVVLKPYILIHSLQLLGFSDLSQNVMSKNITFHQVGDTGVYRVQFSILSLEKPETLQAKLVLKHTDIVPPITFLYGCSWFHSSFGGNVLPIFLDNEKIIPAYGEVKLKFKYIFQLSSSHSKSYAFLILNSGANPQCHIKPCVWTSLSPLTLAAYNYSSKAITLKKNSLIAFAIPCFCIAGPVTCSSAAPTVVWDTLHRTLSWTAYKVIPDPEGIASACMHLALKQLSTSDEMCF